MNNDLYTLCSLIVVLLSKKLFTRAASAETTQRSGNDIIKDCNGILYRLMIDSGVPVFPATACDIKQVRSQACLYFTLYIPNRQLSASPTSVTGQYVLALIRTLTFFFYTYLITLDLMFLIQRRSYMHIWCYWLLTPKSVNLLRAFTSRQRQGLQFSLVNRQMVTVFFSGGVGVLLYIQSYIGMCGAKRVWFFSRFGLK